MFATVTEEAKNGEENWGKGLHPDEDSWVFHQFEW